MVQRDYILRMIEQLGAFVAGIVELSRRGKYQEALALVDQGLLRYVGLSAGMVDSLSDEELVALLRLQGGGASGAPDAEKLAILATLLREEAAIRDARGAGEDEDDNIDRHLKALNLALEAGAAAEATGRDDLRLAAAITETVEAGVARLAAYELPERTRDRLFAHYERVGNYAGAEDLLFELIEGGYDEDGLIRRGLAFYRRLAAKGDAELAAGNLPRAEVEEGLARLRAFRATFEKG